MEYSAYSSGQEEISRDPRADRIKRARMTKKKSSIYEINFFRTLEN